MCNQLAWGQHRQRLGCGRVPQPGSGLGEVQGAPSTWGGAWWNIIRGQPSKQKTSFFLLACGSSLLVGLGLLKWQGPPYHPLSSPSRLLSGDQHRFDVIPKMWISVWKTCWEDIWAWQSWHCQGEVGEVRGWEGQQSPGHLVSWHRIEDLDCWNFNHSIRENLSYAVQCIAIKLVNMWCGWGEGVGGAAKPWTPCLLTSDRWPWLLKFQSFNKGKFIVRCTMHSNKVGQYVMWVRRGGGRDSKALNTSPLDIGSMTLIRQIWLVIL